MDLLLPLIVMLVVSASYFFASPKGTPTSLRLLCAAHGVTGAVLFVGAMTIGYLKRQHVSYALPLAWLHLIPVLLVIVTLVTFRGPKWLHLSQLANVAAMLWTFFIGSMAITGEWL